MAMIRGVMSAVRGRAGALKMLMKACGTHMPGGLQNQGGLASLTLFSSEQMRNWTEGMPLANWHRDDVR